MRGYRISRDVYHRIRKPEVLAERRQARRFYGALVAPGELAFDVGAYKGDVSEALAYCGAVVVAVEPNPDLARRLRRLRIASAVEEVAIGAEPQRAQLRLGIYSGHSTLSQEWAALAGSDRFGGVVDVDVTTLEELIARYGEPAYIKIDVEGYEGEVLAGLARPVRIVSFEFQCAALGIAEKALRRLAELGRYEYNLTVLEERRFVTRFSEGAQEILARLDEVRDRSETAYGDVYARLVSAKGPLA